MHFHGPLSPKANIVFHRGAAVACAIATATHQASFLLVHNEHKAIKDPHKKISMAMDLRGKHGSNAVCDLGGPLHGFCCGHVAKPTSCVVNHCGGSIDVSSPRILLTVAKKDSFHCIDEAIENHENVVGLHVFSVNKQQMKQWRLHSIAICSFSFCSNTVLLFPLNIVFSFVLIFCCVHCTSFIAHAALFLLRKNH